MTLPLVAINTLSVPDEHLGGGYTYLRNLLPHLIDAASGARFHLLAATSNRRHFAVESGRVEWTIVNDRWLSGSLRTVIDRWWAPRWLRRIHADLYFVPYGWLPKRPPCPTVWTFQNLLLLDSTNDGRTIPATWPGRLRERLRRWVISRIMLPATAKADRIIAVSAHARNELVREYPACAERARVVHEGVQEDFTPVGDPPADRSVLRQYGLTEPYMLSVSTLMRHKRFDVLIRTFADFKRRTHFPGTLAIVGDDWGGYRKRLERLAREVESESCVHFLGHVRPSDLPALYRRATAFVLLSACESFGLPALEAMACGCPTVAADASGLAEVVGDGGILIDPENPEKLADVLAELASSPKRRAALSRAGCERAQLFSWSTAAQRTVEVFEDVLGRISEPQQLCGRLERRQSVETKFAPGESGISTYWSK